MVNKRVQSQTPASPEAPTAAQLNDPEYLKAALKRLNRAARDNTSKGYAEPGKSVV